jgi:integrase
MRSRITFDLDLIALMQDEIAVGEKAVTAAMLEAGTSLKSVWPGQITGAGLGTRLGNSICLASLPESVDTLNAAALVWSNAPVIIGAHDTGPLIWSKDGVWLAIPTPAAGKSTKGGRITPGEWKRRTGVRIPSILDLIDAGLNHGDVGASEAKSEFERARRLRDAALIVLLAMVPIRRKNFLGLEIGRTIHVDREEILITLPAGEVKNKLRYEIILREPGAALLRRYLSEARPFLDARSSKQTNALWLADTGLPYGYGYIGRRIPFLTEKLIGVNVPPHFFRDATATTFARTSPELARGTKAILGHSDHRTAERHYNHAQSIEAGRSLAEIIGGLTEGKVPGSRSAK